MVRVCVCACVWGKVVWCQSTPKVELHLHLTLGWHLGEGDQWAKYTTLEIGTRTPLILRAPWLASSHSSPNTVTHARTFVEMVDIYPTLADLAGIPPPPHAEGLSVVSALTHPANTSTRTSASSQFAHCCWGQHPPQVNDTSLCGMCWHTPSANISYMGYAVRDQDYRFVEWYRWLGEKLLPDCSGLMAMELYPHTGDTGRGEQAFDSAFETRNLAINQSLTWGVDVGQSAGPYADVIERMHKELLVKFPKSLGRCGNKTHFV